jgi:hypothetical protein
MSATGLMPVIGFNLQRYLPDTMANIAQLPGFSWKLVSTGLPHSPVFAVT